MTPPPPQGPSLGIDLGTSHTTAVVRRADGSVRPLLFDGAPLMPSAVCVDPNGVLLVGRDAVHSGRRHPERYEPNPKRLIDRDSALLGGKEVAVSDLLAAVLKAVADEARRVVGAPRQVTITVPADWGPGRRGVIESAAAASGLGRVRLVPEPVSAATYFAETLGHRIPVGQSIVVYDLGAGTFDASVVRRTPLGFETVALDGRADLGGLDIDAALIDHLAETYSGHEAWNRLTNPTGPEERRAFRDFQEEIRGAKERLSRHQQADIAIPLLEVEAHLTRAELERTAAPLLERTVQVTQAVIRAAGLEVAHSAGVFLVGGASRMPLVATMLHRALGVAPTVLDQPEVVVAEGSVHWIEPDRPATAPTSPQPTPQPTFLPAHQPSPATPPHPISAPPATEADRARKKRRTRAVVVAVIIVDVLIIAVLLAVFRPGGDADGDTADGATGDGATGDSSTDPGLPEPRTIQAHDDAISGIVVPPGADGITYTASADGTVKRWDIDDRSFQGSWDAGSAVAIGMVEFSFGERVAGIDRRLGVHAWEPGAFEVEQVHEPLQDFDPNAIRGSAVGTHDGHAVIALMSDDAYTVYDLEDGLPHDIVPFTDEQRRGRADFAVFDGAVATVTVEPGGEIALFDAVTGQSLGTDFEAAAGWDETDRPESVNVVKSDGVPYVLVFKEERLYRWNLETGAFEDEVYWGSEAPERLARNSVPVDGEQALVSIDEDGAASLRSLDSGEALADFSLTESVPVTYATTASYDGYTIAFTGHDDGTVRLWKLGEG
ncbi:hypothetical protein GCM10027447_04840 [Glycomyces halotolerans]